MTAYIIQVIVFAIIVHGMSNKTDVYSCFTEGAKEGMMITADVLPNIIGIMVAVSMIKASGAIELLSNALRPVLEFVGMPADLIPLVLLRPVSGSGAIGIVNDVFKTAGPDSYSGRIASVMMGSTETTFYTIALFYGAANIKNTRHTVRSALAADISGFVLSIIVCRLFFGI